MTITERIDAVLQRRNMSRRQLAKAANIPPSSLQSAMERGKNLSTDMVRKIAKALDVDFVWLCFGEKTYNEIRQAADKLRETIGEPNLDTIFNDFYSGIEIVDPSPEQRIQAILKLFYAKLNLEGQKKVYEYANDLAGNEKYCKPFKGKSKPRAPSATSGDDEKPEEE